MDARPPVPPATPDAPESVVPAPDAKLARIEGDLAETQMSRLLDGAFGTPDGRRFFDDFPVWDPKLAHGKVMRIGAFRRSPGGARLVACAAARIGTLRAGGLPVAIIGAVATLPEERGQGWASRLVELLVGWSRDEGAALAMLWGSEVNLYRRLGFDLCGTQLRMPLAGALAGDPAPPDPRWTCARGWTRELRGLLRVERQEGLTIAPEDWAWFEAHRGTHWWSASDERGAQAYAAIGRGIDLPNIVHEWGGEPAALRALLARVREENPGCEIIGPPGSFAAGAVFAPGAAEGAMREYLGLVQVLRPAETLRALIGDVAVRADENGDRVELMLDQVERLSVPRSALASVLFGEGPVPARTMSRHFPLPLWIWGLDAG